jgi:Protein of unknown function (DUF1592)/Protein of unknown function (DUF1588)/Protein of unknown function (DUF1595)/Protein of unknown function (DUF1585)/Protein of unknown function (DUF1587)
MNQMRTTYSFSLAALVALMGCTGHIGSTSSVSGIDGEDGLGEGGGNGTPGADGGTDDDPTTGGTKGKPAVPSPLSRMTSLQYNNTLRDLFAPIEVPTQSPPADIAVDSFGNNAAAQTASTALVEAYHSAAKEVTAVAMASASEFLGCSPTTRSAEDSCASEFFTRFGRKAYRRPLTAAELSRYEGFYSSLRDDGSDFESGMTLSVEAMLQSPGFLYRVEVGSPVADRDDVVKLLPYELASRLSYLLWNTMPDDKLLDAAKNGGLDDKSGIEEQARRMLEDPRARDAVANFHAEWLHFEKMNDLQKDPTLFPDFNEDTAKSLRASAEKYVETIFFEKDSSLETLLTDDHAWVDDAIADIYEVASPGSKLALVPVDSEQRSGILTNAGLMAGFAHETTNSPVLRGVFILNSIMCTPLPPPPPGVAATAPAPDEGKPLTTRERFETQHEQGTCATCHHSIDGVGFAFENYDAVGKWRTTEFGLPVDASGWFADNAGDLAGTFEGAVELGSKLADSALVHACVAEHWLRYALGVDRNGIDRRGLQPIVDAFEASGLSMREMVIALTTSDAFTTRVIVPE